MGFFVTRMEVEDENFMPIYSQKDRKKFDKAIIEVTEVIKRKEGKGTNNILNWLIKDFQAFETNLKNDFIKKK